MLPSLQLGFMLDDFIYLFRLDDSNSDLDLPRNLFSLIDGVREHTARWCEEGGLPWWTYDEVKFVFWRPLSAALMRFDHAVFGTQPIPYHVHSLLWWLATMFGAALVLRTALPPGAGLLAYLLFAMDESHVLPAGWVANRNALVAAAPAFVGLWAHLRWRRDGWKLGRWLAPIGLAVGLAGGETALSVGAYFLAFELWGRSGGWRERFAGLLPVGIVTAIYWAAYRLSGSGASGSGIYFDPMRDPIGYLQALPSRILTMLSGGLMGLQADLWFFEPRLRPALIAAGALGCVLLSGMLRSAWPSLSPPLRRDLRWMLIGAGLALLPVAATFPADRLLLVSGLGLSAGIAVALQHAWRSLRSRGPRVAVAVGFLFGLLHLVLAPLTAVRVQSATIDFNRRYVELARTVELGATSSGSPLPIVLNPPDHIVGIYLPLMIWYFRGTRIDSYRPLSLAPHSHRVTIAGSDTLILEVVGGGMMEGLFEQLYRGPAHPLSAGMRIDRGLLQAEILDAANGRPTRVAFHFDRPLDDPSLLILEWRDGSLRRADLPAPGDTLLLPRSVVGSSR